MTSGWTEVSASIKVTADGSWSTASTSEGRAWTSTLVWNVEVRTFNFIGDGTAGRGGEPGRRRPESSAGQLILVKDDGAQLTPVVKKKWSGSDHLWRSSSRRTCR